MAQSNRMSPARDAAERRGGSGIAKEPRHGIVGAEAEGGVIRRRAIAEIAFAAGGVFEHRSAMRCFGPFELESASGG